MRILLAVVSFIMLGSTLICGLWMKGQPKVDPSSVSFHSTLAIATVVVTVVTIGVLMKR